MISENVNKDLDFLFILNTKYFFIRKDNDDDNDDDDKKAFSVFYRIFKAYKSKLPKVISLI